MNAALIATVAVGGSLVGTAAIVGWAYLIVSSTDSLWRTGLLALSPVVIGLWLLFYFTARSL